MERDISLGHACGDDRVNLRLPQRVSWPLPGIQLEHDAIEIGDRQASLGEDLAQLFHGGFLDFHREAILAGKANQFLDRCAIFLHLRFGFEAALGDRAPEGSQHHPQASQGAGITPFPGVEWKLGTHSIREFLWGRQRSVSPAAS